MGDYEYSYDYGELIATDDSYDNNDGDSQDTPRDYDSVSYNQFFREVPLDYYYDPDELSLAGSADEEGPVREDYDYSQDLRTDQLQECKLSEKTVESNNPKPDQPIQTAQLYVWTRSLLFVDHRNPYARELN